MSNLIALIFYVLTLVMIIGIILSYVIALKIKQSLSILALLLFFIMTAMSVSLMGLAIGLRFFEYDPVIIPFPEVRAILYFAVSAFLLYTTWRKN
jgi:hypothetical protein